MPVKAEGCEGLALVTKALYVSGYGYFFGFAFSAASVGPNLPGGSLLGPDAKVAFLGFTLTS